MATINGKDLLVWVKAMSRGQALPLDASEIHESYDDAVAYASTATAYAGQTVKVLMDDGKYHTYTLQPSDDGYILEEIVATVGGDEHSNKNILDSYNKTQTEILETAKSEAQKLFNDQIKAALTIVEF